MVYLEGKPDAFAHAGGTCGNVLSVLSYLNWSSSAVGYLGDDEAGRLVRKDLTQAKVGSEYLHHKAGAVTPVFVQQLQHDDQGIPHHTFTRKCPSCGSPMEAGSQASTPIKKFNDAETPDVFFMDRLSQDILTLAESAKGRGALVFYEPSAKGDAQHWSDARALVDIVKYSADRFSSGELETFTHSGKSLWEIQTMGAKGLRYRHHADNRVKPSNWIVSSGYKAPRVVDTCGAGDWCSAGLLSRLLSKSQDISSEAAFTDAVHHGQALAAWACAFVGARGAMYASTRSQTIEAVKEISEGEAIDMTPWPRVQKRHSTERLRMSFCSTGPCVDVK
ncbi:PfkB family carbohydrate kinase [Nevskia ramosa]|uniref:PfkB family carbohydrate kinase n=1 Tax=Nevskia ramosa TaxID=64002 RepID=UPI0023544F3E